MTIRQKLLLSTALLGIVSLLLLIIFGDNGLTDWFLLRARNAQLEQKNTTLARENARIYRQIDRLKNDPSYIEIIARRELGMIGRKEVIVKPLKSVGTGDSPSGGIPDGPRIQGTE